MNTRLFKFQHIFIVFLSITFMVGCKSNVPSLTKEERIRQLSNAIEQDRYTFSAQSATPMSYKMINLTYGYYLKVSKDTIQVHLPYYGQSHTAPMNPMDIGFNFTSTNFEYQKEFSKDSWTVVIKIKDNPSKSQIYLDLSTSGYANLQIIDNNRQSISYRGIIEVPE